MKSNTHAERRKYHFIYKTTCLVTGRWYIGLHSTDHLDDGYLGSGTRLQYSLKKYGREQHAIKIQEFLPTRKDLVQREIELLTEEVLKDPMCMNLMKGGGREIHSNIIKEKARAKISETGRIRWARLKADPDAYAEHIAKINTPEIVAKRTAAIKAKEHKRSEEQLQRMKAGQAKYYAEQSTEAKTARQRKGTWGRVKTYKVEDTSGSIQLVTNIQSFSAEHQIKGTALYKTEARKNFANGYRIVGRV